MADNDTMKIKITTDGPYEVGKDIPLHKERIICDNEGTSVGWEKGKQYNTPEGMDNYKLCRCGHAKTKPYCDGTHMDTGFCGKEHADRPPYVESARHIKGRGVDLLDDENLCVGARFCDRGGSIWRDIANADDPEVAHQVIEEACNCPGGRLTIAKKAGTLIEPELQKEISLANDPINNMRGPLWVKGGIEIEGARGEKYETRNRVALCRCGESNNMPYCDGAHYNCEHMEGQDE